MFEDGSGSADGSTDGSPAVDAPGGGRRHGLSLEDVADVLRELRRADPVAMGDSSLLAASLLVEEAQQSLDVLRCHLLGELDVRGTTDTDHGMRTASWLADRARLPRPVARRSVRLGAALRRLPGVDAAFTTGRIGVEHVAVLVRVANPRIAAGIDAAVPALIEDLGASPFEVWAAEVEAFARLLDVDGPTPDERPSSLAVSPVGDEHVLKGRFTGLDGEAIAHAIDTITDELYRQAVRDAEAAAEDLPVPSRSELRARALLELVRRGVADHHRGPGPAPEVTLVLHAHPTDVEGAAAPSPRPDGLVDLHAPNRRHLVSPHHVVLCDPIVHPVVVDHLGVPLDAGRTARYATPTQRRALAARDGGCTFPGCDAPTSWCDAHHVIPWDRNGPTDLPNLALLCRHHHGVTHRTGWTMRATPDQRFTWTTPSGATLHSQRHHTRPPPDPPG